MKVTTGFSEKRHDRDLVRCKGKLVLSILSLALLLSANAANYLGLFSQGSSEAATVIGESGVTTTLPESNPLPSTTRPPAPTAADAAAAAAAAQQPEEAVVGAGVTLSQSEPRVACPALNPPRGLLFVHVSKTGGTTMRHYMANVAKQAGLPLTYVNRTSWPKILKRQQARQFVFNQDISRVPLTDEARRQFFVIAAIRPPCSYAFSLWSYRSNAVYRHQEGFTMSSSLRKAAGIWIQKFPASAFGVEPYNTTANREIFALAASSDSSGMDVEQRIGARLGVPPGGDLLDKVDCWVRTQSFDEDFARCLQQYAECGGESSLKLPHIKPSNVGHHVGCRSFFDDSNLSSTASLLMERNPIFANSSRLGSKLFGGSCC